MQKAQSKKIVLAAIVVVSMVAALALAGCSQAKKTYTKIDDLKDQVVAAQMGTTGTDWVRENLPSAKLKEYTDTSEALAALLAGDVEAVFFDEPVAAWQVANTYSNAAVLETIPTGEQYGFAFSKNNSALRNRVNKALQTLKANGKFDAIYSKWFPGASIPSLKQTDQSTGSSTENDELKLIEPGKLYIASDCDYPPFISGDGNQVQGFEYDLMLEIGAEPDLEIKYRKQNFDTILTAVASGASFDIGVSSLTISEERRKIVDFGIPYCDSNQACVVLKSSLAK